MLITWWYKLFVLQFWIYFAFGNWGADDVFDDVTLIPRIDLQQSPAEIVSALKDAADANGPGFFYLFNHGIPDSVFHNAVRESHKFHSLPLRKKLEISSIGYGGGTKSQKGFVPPLAEGSYDKDATDVRPESEKESGKRNLREALVFRYPEEADVKDDLYFKDYNKFLEAFDKVHGDDADSSSELDAQNATVKFSHSRNRLADVDRLHQAAQRFFKNNQWPKTEDVPRFRETVELYFAEMRKLASTMWGLMSKAISLSLDRTINSSSPDQMIPHDKGMMTFNLVHYPAFNGDDDAMGIIDHTDWEAFTLLYPMYLENKHLDGECSVIDGQDKDVCSSFFKNNPNVDKETGVAFTGLEVWYRDRWVAVPHVPGAILVNQGEMLSRLSAGQFKTPVHRVQAKNDFPRYSLISFWAPNYDVLLPDPDLPYGKVLAGEHYCKRNHLIEDM
eukprot:gnl/MRDRNA2_/MRDRNA2_20072_c0_seq1.p1 gnl/MRDRNA2_/MRDRNA2_20072_c0~~gnl/MRDRNA2_/MRDRNA2_20072_c0_seq1.p1  ORF type:complete len:446 (+),score=97.76 gnl/MRDRNA2_/MRDRNA2_20072_c0_seq1:85-1422(+)